ncbi:MAG TPA: F0F1 ATP synthase subunit A [Xanthobacteraceae bacterium]|nr:F0F1 ATP synthase subunit A [Xanthobacteraceae bacterium]
MAAAANPIEQFEIHEIFPVVKIAGQQISLTDSALYMILAVVLTAALMLGTTAGRRLVPTRMQSVAELIYEFVANMIRSTAGEHGLKFFPLVFSIFMFVLISNLIGLVPLSFSVTSQIVVTASLALLVFFTVVIHGFWQHGLHFLKLFAPSGVPIYIMPMIVLIEILSFFTRPVSHSLRLFANILAGHVTLNLVGSFAMMMIAGFGIVGWLGAVLPLAFAVALFALELLVALLQAYVFAILTCIYLNDSLHPAH